MVVALNVHGQEDIVEKVKDRRPQLSADAANDAIRERNWLIGASIANIAANFDQDFFQLGINPRAGYFLSDRAAVGTEVQLFMDIYDGGEDWRYALTPFVRYYFPEGASPRNRWFGEAILGFGGSSEEDNEGDSAFDIVYGLRAGYAHFVGSNVALEAILGYTGSDADVSVGIAQTGLGISLGLQVYLPSRMNAQADE